jgi:hypothetical protein
MNRLLTLTSTGLFAAGLAILPMSVNAATAPETKAPVTAPMAGPDGKAAPVAKSDSVAKDAMKPNTATTTPATTVPSTAATTAPTTTGTAKPAATQPPGHSAVHAPSTSGAPAKVGG